MVKIGSAPTAALAMGLREAGGGVFQLITDYSEGQPDAQVQIERLKRLADISGRPVSYTLVQKNEYPKFYDKMLTANREASQVGYPIRPQVMPRPVGLVFGLEMSLHPFRFNPSYLEIHQLPLAERVKAMRDPERRRAILSEQPIHRNPQYIYAVSHYDRAFPLGELPIYEPAPGEMMWEQAKRRGITAAEVIYDALLERDGKAILLQPHANLSDGNLDAVRKMIGDDASLIGLGDGGAHYGAICDASFPTTMLAYWTRDRGRDLLPLEWCVNRLTRNNALAVGLDDRGLVAEGYKADINVINYDQLQLLPPKPAFDLPGGALRMTQPARGYTATIVSGEITYRDGVPTDAMPGRLIRKTPAPC